MHPCPPGCSTGLHVPECPNNAAAPVQVPLGSYVTIEPVVPLAPVVPMSSWYNCPTCHMAVPVGASCPNCGPR